MEKACLTTKDIINNGGTIYSVLRDIDDEWQFFGKDEPEDENIMVVSVEKIWQRFPDVKELCKKLEMGFYAYRNGINEEWIIAKYES